jgi:inhibitor of KinA
MLHPFSIFPLGDSALVVELGTDMDAATSQRTLQLFRQLQQHPLPGVLNLVPAYASLSVFYDPVQIRRQGLREGSAFEQVAAWIEGLPVGTMQDKDGKDLRIPVCYGSNWGPDLEELAAFAGLPAGEVVRLHHQSTYRVYMIGFLPGFPYLGEVDPRIAMPRKERPRLSVAAGSVGIAGGQTGIYPFDSPGGWQIIGRTPLSMFDADQENPALLSPGMTVEFYPITPDEFAHYQGGAAR